MSSRSTPIPAHLFSTAIKDLPLENLHSKATELQNSITHLESSNEQLKPYVDDDQDCADAIEENKDVITQMENRISLLRLEVERRGFKWGEQEREFKVEAKNGCSENDGEHHGSSSQQGLMVTSETNIQINRVSSDEVARVLPQQTIEEGYEREEDGVHL